ncbi:HMCN1 protein, partial [Amia calva]|nr:HMCN1 protein [Amia calva]
MDCPIEIYPERVVVRYGDPVAANCTVTQTTSGMGWEATVGPTGMQNDTSLLWRVSNLTDWNEEPRCFGIFLTEPIRCEKNLSISLYKYPDSVSISSVGHTGPMEEGRQYRLQCDVQSIAPVQYLSVNWYRGGALIHTLNFSEDTTRTPVNVSPTLLITPSRTDDGVQYTCEAELRLGPGGPQANQSEPLNITVLWCPDRVEVMEHQTLGDSVVCTVQGSPAPETSWIKDGREVDASAPLSRTDGGLYTYRAFNTYGSTTHNVSVEVLCERSARNLILQPVSVTYESPSFPVSPSVWCPDRVEVMEHQTLGDSVVCTVQGSPAPETSWIKDGREVDASAPLSRTDGGLYTYRAFNTYGSTTHNVSVEVLWCPDSVSVQENHSLGSTVNCTAQGNPQPQITWLRGGQPIDISAGLSRTEGGQFTLRVTSPNGNATHTVNVAVVCKLLQCTGNRDAMDCPIEIYPERVVVRYGDPVAANCTVTQTTSGMGWEATVGPTGMQNDTSLLWRVSNLTDWNEEPRCFGIFLTEPIRCEKNLSISLYKYPDSVSISSVGHTGPMEEGRQYRLQCDVQSIAPVQYLSVNWYRGGALIHTLNFSEDTTRTPVNVSPTLLITPSRTDDGVQYTCEAELRLGPEGPQDGPEITGCPDSVSVQENRSLGSTVNCTAQGNPQPQITWLRGGQPIDISAGLSRTEGGQFTLRVTSPNGNATHTVNVAVVYKPVFKSKSEDSLSIYQGELLVLNCSAHGNPPPKYHWKYSEALNKEERDIGDGSTYNVSEASPGQSGFYTCTVSNKQGETSQKFSVTVKEKVAAADCPLKINPARVVVKHGDSVSVNCTATRTTRGMGWEATVGSTGIKIGPQSVLWNVSSLTDWTTEPRCFVNFETEPKQCEKKLNISLYKYPASVSISSQARTAEMKKRGEYLLQCEVRSIAPVQYLAVNWYRGEALINTVNFSNDTTRTPVDVPVIFMVTPTRTVQYFCEAELRLGPEGPQPNPAMKSEALEFTIMCKINKPTLRSFPPPCMLLRVLTGYNS